MPSPGTRPVQRMVMRERENRVMAHLPYDVPGGRAGTTVRQLARELNISEDKVRHALRTLVGRGVVRRIRVKTLDFVDGERGTWKVRYAIERK